MYTMTPKQTGEWYFMLACVNCETWGRVVWPGVCCSWLRLAA